MKFFWALAACGVLSGCDATLQNDPRCEEGQVLCGDSCIEAVVPTASALTAQVFGPSCSFASCHGSEGPKEGLSLHDTAALAAAIDKPSAQNPDLMLIAPGDPQNSYIVRKLRGQGIAPTDSTGQSPGRRMPPSTPLCDALIEAVAVWVEQGAPID